MISVCVRILFPTEVRPPDVLLGRGAMSNRNLGNLYFRQLISYYRDSYNTLRKGAKGQLARNICNYVRRSGGRFLEKRHHVRSENQWYECGDDRAQAKCAQALRETNLVRCISSSTNDDDDSNDACTTTSSSNSNGSDGPMSMGDHATK